MTEKELLRVLDDKRKGRLVDAQQMAQMIDPIIVIAERIVSNNKIVKDLTAKIAEDRNIISALNTHLPLVYREAKRIFTTPKEPQP